VGQILQVFGQAPLAYYIAHLWLFAIVGAIWFRGGTAYPVVYAVWILGQVPLYFAARAFRDFKMRKAAESVWRMF